MRTKEQILQGEPEDLFATSCYFDINKFAERVLGLKLKPFHKEWLGLLKKHDRIALAAPTGFGKSTIFGVVFPIWMAFYKPKSVCLIISKTIRTQSANILEEIKLTIEDNEYLKHLKPSNNEEIKSSWTKEKIITTNGSKIQYSSYSINVRGIQADYEFCDEVATYPTHELFFRDVATRVVSKGGILAAVSTPLTTTDLLAKLMNTKGYYSKIYDALPNGESIWPERFPTEYLKNEEGRIGKSNFERNYRCNPKAEVERAMYPLISIELCYDITKSLSQKTTEGSQVYMAGDFAISSGAYADFDCYIVVEKVGDYITILWGETNKMPSKAAKINRLRQLYELYRPIRVVLDESQIGNAIIQDLKTEGIPVMAQSFHSAARSHLLINLQDVIQDGRLIIPLNRDDEYTGAFADRLTSELLGFAVERSEKTGNVNYVSKASHDDTVMALAMAISIALSRREITEDFIGDENTAYDAETKELMLEDPLFVDPADKDIPLSGEKIIKTWE